MVIAREVDIGDASARGDGAVHGNFRFILYSVSLLDPSGVNANNTQNPWQHTGTTIYVFQRIQQYLFRVRDLDDWQSGTGSK